MFDKILSLVPLQKGTNYELFYEIFPGLNKLKDTPQDKYYHSEGDVWTHTIMVCDSLFDLEQYNTGNTEEKFVMFYAALLHDFSKPACTKIEDDGRISSKGHSKMGAIDVRIALWKLGVPIMLRERICGIIQSHQVPFFAFSKPKVGFPSRNPKFLAHRLSHQCIMKELITVAKADMIGRHCVEKEHCLEDIELFEMLCIEENCYYHPKEFPDNITKLQYFQSEGAISPEYPFYKETGSTVHIISGLPASGKDFFISRNLSGLPVLSFDDAKAELGLKHSDNPGHAVQLVKERTKELLREKKDFVINATNLISALRIKTLGLLHNYNAYTIIYCIEATDSEIKKRNSERDSSITNKKIDSMMLRWELPQSTEAHEVIYINNSIVK